MSPPAPPPNPATDEPPIRVENLRMAFGNFVVMDEINFEVASGEIVFLIGGSGCGKSTLMRHLIGILSPASGKIYHHGEDYFAMPPSQRDQLGRRFGILFQSGALFSSLSLFDNVALPLRLHTALGSSEIRERVHFKLALVGLEHAAKRFPHELSGGMVKRAGLARALALEPETLFIDEPSAGLDPVSSFRLDELILELSRQLQTSVVIVSHELPSLFAIADKAVFLDANSRRMLAVGDPREMAQNSPHDTIREFLNRGSDPRDPSQSTVS